MPHWPVNVIVGEIIIQIIWEKVEVSLGFLNLWPVAFNKVLASLRLNKRSYYNETFTFFTNNQML